MALSSAAVRAATLRRAGAGITWQQQALQFVAANGRPIAPQVVKAGANAAAAEARAGLAQLTLELAQAAQGKGGFTRAEVRAWSSTAKSLLKTLHGANEALARGGLAQMTPAHWAAAAGRAERSLDAVDRVAARIERGGYGPELTNGQLLTHAQNLTNAGRSTYENARVDNARDAGHDEFKRLLAAGDNCTSDRGLTGCVEAASMGWVSRDELIEIGDCTCHGNCNCVLISRRSGAARART